jgi:hypothetical protein
MRRKEFRSGMELAESNGSEPGANSAIIRFTFMTMLFRKHLFRNLALALAAGATAVAGLVFAQGGAPTQPGLPDPSYGVFNFSTKIGSFKLLDGVGKVEVSFTGTILISQLKGTVVPAGSIKKEYSSKDKEVWHGTGKLVIDGSFRGIQFFGTNMTGKWVGRGRARIYGEFDRNLETGYYYYGTDVSRKVAWSMYGMELSVPQFQQGGTGVPVERKPGGGRPGG